MYQDEHEDLELDLTTQRNTNGLGLPLESNQNDEILWVRESKTVNYNWTKEATRLLIGLRTELDFEFDDPNQRKMDLWERISETLKEHGYGFPPSICDKKWRNLLVSFRRTCSRGTQGKINRFPYTWEFYNDLVDYWQKKDPAGLRALSNGPNENMYNSGSLYAEEALNDNENDPDPGDGLDVNGGGEEEDDDMVEGDMNRFLTVTLSDSEDDSGQDHGDPPFTIEEIDINPSKTFRLDERHENRTLEITPANFSSDLHRQRISSPSIPKSVDITLQPATSHTNRPTPHRPTPTITIEEITPQSQSIRKRTFDDLEDHEVTIQRKYVPSPSRQAIGTEDNCVEDYCGPRPTKRRLERYDNNCNMSNNHIHNNITTSQTQEPPPWFLEQARIAEEKAQRRWEITEARQTREFELRRGRDLHKIKSLNNMTILLTQLIRKSSSSPANYQRY